MVTNSPQRVSKECVKRMEKLGLYAPRKSSFDSALEVILSFCEKKENKKEFEKWTKKNLK